ncbi:uncharacterized protein LOC127278485 isoform X2 [Leptopilina boulardi]|uniref:uncharacterized protein LOC127278485 isoform X2 n=2 Tax=Leptopilina boulardi TaxID=63433 RepID=UPI0021F643CA|nr:uncharacterized protein LOC127278485 isoform X2 [Leptopilina boulardi]
MHVSLKEMFLKRGNSFIICFIILLLRNVLSDDNGRCIIYKEDGNEMSEDDWLNGIYLPAIDDNSSKKLLWSLKTKNIKKMQFQFNTNHNNYFNISLDPHSYYLSINLTDEFANYEEYESVDAVEIKISFQCSIEQKLVIIQPIMDFNNHNPEFLNAPYDFTIGMPILKNYSFDSHGIVIMARDIDISNKNVTFNIKSVNDETKGFYLLWSGQSIDDKNKPIFKARLITTELIDLHNDVTLKIFVQDTGKPVRNANTTISIRVNSARSTLKFSKSLYVADCRSAEVEKDVDIEFDNKILILRGAEADVSVDFVSNPTDKETC